MQPAMQKHQGGMAFFIDLSLWINVLLCFEVCRGNLVHIKGEYGEMPHRLVGK